MEVFVYVLYNQHGAKIYIGHTKDLQKRLARHNTILPSKSSSYTFKIKGAWKLIYFETFASRREALQREQQLKSYQGRKFIRDKILLS